MNFNIHFDAQFQFTEVYALGTEIVICSHDQRWLKAEEKDRDHPIQKFPLWIISG